MARSISMKELVKYAKEYAEDLSDAAANVATEAFVLTFNGVVSEAPVGNPSLWKSQRAPEGYSGGQWRSNFVLSENVPDLTTTDATNLIPKVNASDFKNVKLGATYYFTNSLPYSYKLEYTGHSSQIPNGVIRKNAAKFDATVNKIARSVS